MGVLKKVRRLVSKRIGREHVIRYRLFRASLRAMIDEREADVLLISYPKCGRTWLRMLLSRVLQSHCGIDDVDYMATDVLGGAVGDVPHIRFSHDDNPHWKTPARLATSKRRYRHKKVILLVRDPRDVVVSMYFERTRRERAYTGSLHDFLHEPKGSLDTILAYYNVWARARTTPADFFLVRYEDLKRDSAGTLGRLLSFVGVSATDEHIAEAVSFASFQNMRKMESNELLESGRLRPRDPDDVESFKTRRGKVGGYVDYLEPEQIAWMEARIRDTLDPYYGYREPPGDASRAAASTPPPGQQSAVT